MRIYVKLLYENLNALRCNKTTALHIFFANIWIYLFFYIASYLLLKTVLFWARIGYWTFQVLNQNQCQWLLIVGWIQSETLTIYKIIPETIRFYNCTKVDVNHRYNMPNVDNACHLLLTLQYKYFGSSSPWQRPYPPYVNIFVAQTHTQQKLVKKCIISRISDICQ